MKPNHISSQLICRKAGPVVVLLLGFGLLCVAVRAGEVKFALPPETAALKPGPGLPMASQCLICHSADYISTQPLLTRAAWKAEVEKMIQKYGAPIATNAADEIVEYLTVNYGQENLTNSAAAK